jgi:hypothetical protein
MGGEEQARSPVQIRQDGQGSPTRDPGLLLDSPGQRQGGSHEQQRQADQLPGSGFRTVSTFVDNLYHCLGKLPLSEMVHNSHE